MKGSLLFLLVFNFIFFSIANAQSTFSLKAKISNRYSFRGTTVQATNYDLIVPLNTDSGLYILRVDKTGKAKWQKKFGLQGDQVVTICAAPDNGFACFGYIFNTTTGIRQLTLFKCDSAGKIQWTKSLGLDYNNYYIYAQQLILDSKNNYVVTYRLDPFSGPTSQMRIVKFNEYGNIIFQTGFKNLYSPGYQYLHITSITESFDGGFLIALTYANALLGINYAYLLLTDPNGKVVSYKPFNVNPFNAEDYQAPISINKNKGKYYVIGYYNHYENGKIKEYYYFTSFNKIQQQFIATLVPYNRFALQRFVTQNKIPIKNIDGYVINAHNLTAVDYERNEVFVNRYDSIGGICPDYSLPKYNRSVLQNNINTGDEITGVQKSVDNIVITNNELSVQSVDLVKEICSGEAPTFAHNNQSPKSATPINAATIFPNPAFNTITITIPIQKEEQQISLYNNNAQLMQSFSVHNNKITLNSESYIKGVYIIRITGNEYTQTLKFIKE